MLILAIESSCDETAAAVVQNGNVLLSSIISSQIELHTPFGGVVPELASREHLSKIETVVNQALAEANLELQEIDAIAVTQGPGLIGSLLVGVSYAKALAFGLGKPFIGVNHIEGHFYSVVFDNPPIEYPALALIVSGGHTNLFFVPKEGKYKVVSRTRDDAAGEAFDKIAKMLGLGYPGGPAIERLAESGDKTAFKFTRPKISDGRPDFSFSGLKTAVSKLTKERSANRTANDEKWLGDMAASVQNAIVKQLIETTAKAESSLSAKTLVVAGGVACNLKLREAAKELGNRLSLPVYFPSKHLSTDNAAMIAAAAYPKLLNCETSSMAMTADISLRLQNFENIDAELRRKKVKYRL
ncbi:MAG: tRNA (adenosine(37)-N6)-threonylcarbamoyltransferase complex transferase subunit TsaD [Pyrinomonadaceae bacterium]